MDRVVSSFMFHHLEENEKAAMLREVRRVLKPGGRFCLLDFGGSESGGGSPLARLFHSSHRLKDNTERHILALMSQAGFANPERVSRGAMFFGLMRTNYFKASVPASS